MNQASGEPQEPALAHRLAGVEGWLHPDEADHLYRAACRVPAKERPLCFVEIGSWKGRSTIALAAALEDRGCPGRVVAIDPHTGSCEHREWYGEVDTFGEFVENMERVGLAHRVEAVRSTSVQARESLGTFPVDVLFVDGSHEYRDVLQDLRSWLPLLEPPAILVVNDTSWPGVHRALREEVLGRPGEFSAPVLVRSTLFLDFDPVLADQGSPWSLRRLAAVLWVRRAAHRVVPFLPKGLKRAANRVTRNVVGS